MCAATNGPITSVADSCFKSIAVICILVVHVVCPSTRYCDNIALLPLHTHVVAI